MNADQLINALFTLFEQCSIHPSMFNDILAQIKKSGVEKGFLKILSTRLSYLLENGVTATKHKEFENLERGIYSMHISGTGFNIRILYAFSSDRSPLLLYAFFERANHKTTDYTGKIDVALNRLNEMEDN